MINTKTIDAHDLQLLRESLPYGYARMLQKKVKKTTGSDYSLPSIHRGIMHKHMSARIITSAIHLAMEHGTDLSEVFPGIQHNTPSQ